MISKLCFLILSAVQHTKGQAHSSGHPELPNFITLLYQKYGEKAFVQFLHTWENLIFSLLVVAFLGTIAYLASRKSTLIPGSLQNFVELCVEKLDNFVCGILGPRGRRFTPFLGTLFVYILCMNVLGLLPIMKSPTSSINTTAALAICVFLYVQYTGIRSLGFLGYLSHLAGEPRDFVGWVLIPLNLPIHILEEFIKPLSLAMRLFGNIMGEDILVAVFVILGVASLSFLKAPVGLPLQVPFILLDILFATIQALVFTLLSTIYFSLMMPHEEH